MAKKHKSSKSGWFGRKKPPPGGKLGDVAESVGAGLGQFLNQVEAQVQTAKKHRESTVKNLLAIRNRATQLLADMGHAVAEVPLPRLGRKKEVRRSLWSRKKGKKKSR